MDLKFASVLQVGIHHRKGSEIGGDISGSSAENEGNVEGVVRRVAQNYTKRGYEITTCCGIDLPEVWLLRRILGSQRGGNLPSLA